MSQSPCVIVLGMHRSGTSLLLGSLEAGGLYLGDVNHQAPFNKKGNKENEAIRELNDALLTKAGASWRDPPSGQVKWDHKSERQGKALIFPYLEAARPWGFKDPRTMWTVEGWLRLVPGARPIAIFRHPSLVIRSLAARHGSLTVERDDGLRLWCAYNTELVLLHEKLRFPVLHWRPEAFHRTIVAPLTAFARSIGLAGSLDGFFDKELIHQTVPEPIPTVEASHLFECLIEISQTYTSRH